MKLSLIYFLFRTEYTDFLGRTRKCHKSDLDTFIHRDRQLMKAMSKGESNDGKTEHERRTSYINSRPEVSKVFSYKFM